MHQRLKIILVPAITRSVPTKQETITGRLVSVYMQVLGLKGISEKRITQKFRYLSIGQIFKKRLSLYE